MLGPIRILFGDRLTNDRAIEIARVEAEQRNMEWNEPVIVHQHWSHVVVWTNAHSLVGNFVVDIRRSDETVTMATSTPR